MRLTPAFLCPMWPSLLAYPVPFCRGYAVARRRAGSFKGLMKMIDLFGAAAPDSARPQAEPIPKPEPMAEAKPTPTLPAEPKAELTSSKKSSDIFKEGVPTPKIFKKIEGNVDRVVAPPKIHSEPRKKLHTQSEPEAKEKIAITDAKTHLQGKQNRKEGEGLLEHPKRLSSTILPPSEEKLRAEGLLVEDENDPRRTDKWRPEWRPRLKHPGKRGVDNNRAAIQLIESKIQVSKPDVLDLREVSANVVRGKHSHKGDWKKIEDDIVEHIASGGTMASYANASGLSYWSISNRMKLHPDFNARVGEARRMGADALAAEALRIASTPCMTEEYITVYDKNDNVVTKSVKRSDNTYARKLAFQARMQILEKWAPEKYGPNAKPEETGGMAEKLRMARERIRKDYRAAKREDRAILRKLKEARES